MDRPVGTRSAKERMMAWLCLAMMSPGLLVSFVALVTLIAIDTSLRTRLPAARTVTDRQLLTEYQIDP